MSETHWHRPEAPAGGVTGAGRRRGPVDPVLALIHRHYELCAQAADPLEIAAGLEAHGITDRVAARFRHGDVFTLAEEMYARVPREAPADPGAVAEDAGAAGKLTIRQICAHLLPGLVCVAAVVVSHRLGAGAALSTGGLALAAVAGTARAAVRRGPLRAPGARGSALWICWLLAFALFGPWALTALLGTGAGPRGLLDPGVAAGFLAPAFGLLPAAWCVRRFVRRARSLVGDSHDPPKFRTAVRPLLAGTLGLFAVALTCLIVPADVIVDRGAAGPGPLAPGGPLALGLLLFTARLLAVHGFPTPAAVGTGAACAVEAAALLTAALPRTAGPLRSLVQATGPGGVQALACSAAAIGLIAYAFPVLARARAAARPYGQLYDPVYAAALYGSPDAPGRATAYAPGRRPFPHAPVAPRTDRAATR